MKSLTLRFVEGRGMRREFCVRLAFLAAAGLIAITHYVREGVATPPSAELHALGQAATSASSPNLTGRSETTKGKH